MKSFSQEINIKTNIVSAILGMPSLSLEAQVFKRGSLCIGYYQGQYNFLGFVNIQGISFVCRQYFSIKKKKTGLKGSHIDLGLNVQKESELDNSAVNKTLGFNTIIGYQTILFKPRVIVDLGIGVSWTIEEQAQIDQNSAYPRLHISIGYKLKK